MSARLRFGCTLALLSAVGVAWACGDANGTEALTLKSFHGLKASKDGCSYSTEGVVGGLYDVQLATLQGGGDYSLYLELVNNLKSNENQGAGRLNTNQVKVTSVEISFDRSGPWSFLPSSVEIPTGIVVDTGEKAFAPIGAIPTTVAAKMFDRPDVFAKGGVPLRFTAKAKGVLFDGTDAESNDLPFSIDVCSGCFEPCRGSFPEAACSSNAQPDGWTCGKVSPGEGDGSGGTGGTGGTDGGAAGSGGDAAGG